MKTTDIHDVHTFQRYWNFTKLYLFYAKIPTSRDISYLNQAWYSKTNTLLLEFSISTSHSSIFNEPLTRFDHIRSWINFTFEVQIADPLVGVFRKINEGHIVWIIVNWISIRQNKKTSDLFWLFQFGINLQKRKCDSASLFLFDNESKFVLWSNDSFKCTLSLSKENILNLFEKSLHFGR